jgi:UDP-3-O-[3-hydroxymyristoyl] N-acetylglucosamine deacetylase
VSLFRFATREIRFVMHSAIYQQTLSHIARVSGRGYWSSQPVSLTFRPAPPDTGIVFRRLDLPGKPVLRAIATHRVDTPLRTKLVSGSAEVEMIEHVMAALYGMQIDNCMVECDACEMPGLDGSAGAIALALHQAGVCRQAVPAKVLILEEELQVGDPRCGVTARPCTDSSLTLAYHLDYGPTSPIPSSTSMAKLTPAEFLHHIAPARTFLTDSDARELQRMGVAQHVTYRDLLVFGSNGPIDNSLYFPDECSRHKLLDLIGDLALCGMRVLGTIIAHRSGHNLNGRMAMELMALHERLQPSQRYAA